jgi:hypothetical protein
VSQSDRQSVGDQNQLCTAMVSIPIARSITHDDPIGLTRPSFLNAPQK